MWPSMRSHDRNIESKKRLAQRDPSLFEWGARDGLDPLVNSLTISSNSRLSTQSSRMQSEVEELARWLEDGVQDEDAWKVAVSSGVTTEHKLSSWDEEQAKSSEPIDFAKFDDDFTVFVSAPYGEDFSRKSGHSTPIEDGCEDCDGLKPPADGVKLYNPLASVSDFGGGEGSPDFSCIIFDDRGEDLPTHEEILETSSKIFGQGNELLLTANPLGSPKLRLDEKTEASVLQLDGEDESAPFDLSKIFGALQQMKEDISGMENEDERRKAAARVALGLVYGLDAKADS